MRELRLLPLLPSATEIIHALGLGGFQIGRSHECDYPARIAALPVCTRPAIPVGGSSAEIDSLVKNRLASALSVYEVDAELIASLRPTHIITQTQCKVCAVSLDDVEQALRRDMAVDAHIISLEPYALADLWCGIKRVGAACAAEAAAEKLTAQLQHRMDVIEKRAHSSDRRPTIAAIEWLEPLMAAGNWVPELISLAGGRNLFGTAGRHSPWMTFEQLLAADPDVITALPCGFDLMRTRREMHWLTERPAWRKLKAVQSGNVFICDGNQFMNRPGPRLVESLQIFAELLHPAVFVPELEHIGWERLVTFQAK